MALEAPRADQLFSEAGSAKKAAKAMDEFKATFR